MKILAMSLTFLLLASISPSLAADLSSGFSGTFGKSESACKVSPDDDAEIEDMLRVDSAGIGGYELGCQFAGLTPIGDGTAREFITLAACGDDSGVTRPDSFWILISDDGKQLTLQSQNEYAAADESAFLSGDYVRCGD